MPQILNRIPIKRLFPVNQIIFFSCTIHQKISGIQFCVNTASVSIIIPYRIDLLLSQFQKTPNLYLFLFFSQIRVVVCLHHLIAFIQNRLQRIRRRYQSIRIIHRNTVDIRKTFCRFHQILPVIQCTSFQKFHNHYSIWQFLLTSIYKNRHWCPPGILQKLQCMIFVFNLLFQMHLTSRINTKYQFLPSQRMPKPVIDVIFSLRKWLIGDLHFLLLLFSDPDSFQILRCLYIFF